MQNSLLKRKMSDVIREPISKIFEKIVDYDPYEKVPKKFCFNNKVENFYTPNEKILFNGSFENCLKQGISENKWVILSIQDSEDEKCSNFNKYHFNSEVLKIIEKNFLFFYIDCNNSCGKKLSNFYDVQSLPFISITDPITGEKRIEIDTNKYDFYKQLNDFLFVNDFPRSVFYDYVGEDEVVKYDENVKYKLDTNGLPPFVVYMELYEKNLKYGEERFITLKFYNNNEIKIMKFNEEQKIKCLLKEGGIQKSDDSITVLYRSFDQKKCINLLNIEYYRKSFKELGILDRTSIFLIKQ